MQKLLNTKILKLFIITAFLAVVSLPLAVSPRASAQDTAAECQAAGGIWRGGECTSGGSTRPPGGGSEENIEEPTYEANDCNEGQLNKDNCGIVKYLVILINVLSSLAGFVIVGSIIYGGILYTSAGSDSQKVSAAKDRISSAIIALLFFIFGYGLLNYLVPGGLI